MAVRQPEPAHRAHHRPRQVRCVRIAHVTDFYLPRLGGIELHVSDLSARQRAAGHEVEVLTSSPGPADRFVHRLTEGFRRPHVLHPGGVGAGIRAVVDGQYDLVHAHVGVGSPLAFFVARAAARAGIPCVLTVHSLWVGVRPLMTALDSVGRWSRLPIVWTAVSEAAAAPVRRILPRDRAVSVIPNGIDQHRWRGPSAPAARTQLVVAAVMRLSLRKRPFALLKMVRQAQERLGDGTQVHLLVAGDGPLLRWMQAYLRRHGMTGTVTLAGRLDRASVRDMLGRAHVFVAPADLESFGIAALEARCAGLPVVAKSSGGVREFVRDGVEGLLCDTDEDMVQALVRLGSDETLRRRIADHNRTEACPVDWTCVLESTEAAYEQALEGSSTRDRLAEAS
jgi:glycosyltransferase involved in cell wall biosynthesis